MTILIIGILINFIPLAFAIGFNYGIDRQNDLKQFNENKYRYFLGVLK